MWELQSHMTAHIAPSIYKAMVEHGEGSAVDEILWLARRYADQRWDEDSPISYERLVSEALALHTDILIQAVADKAEEYGIETNGGWAVYLDDGWTSIPWCSDDEAQEWWA